MNNFIKYSKYLVAILVVILAVLALTNPSEEEHRAKIERKLWDQAKHDISLVGDASPAVMAGAEEEINSELNDLVFHNYIFFSTTTIGSSRISFGFFKNISLNEDADPYEWVWEDDNAEPVNPTPANDNTTYCEEDEGQPAEEEPAEFEHRKVVRKIKW